jgi:hypothetical protein
MNPALFNPHGWEGASVARFDLQSCAIRFPQAHGVKWDANASSRQTNSTNVLNARRLNGRQP